MIYIYNDYGGTHSTALAASFHLGQLPSGDLTTDEILNVKYFNKLKTADMGKIIFHGIDKSGNPVYTIGRGNDKNVVEALKNLYLILQDKYKDNERIIFSNTSPTVPLAMTFGGLFSRRLKIDSIGIPLLITGAKQSFPQIIRLVEHTIEMAEKSDATVLVLENQNLP